VVVSGMHSLAHDSKGAHSTPKRPPDHVERERLNPPKIAANGKKEKNCAM
jgi:hypothetical protein